MLFNSIDFIIFFAVVVTQYYRSPWPFRLALSLTAIGFPVLRAPPTPEAMACSVFCAAGLVIVTFLRAYRSEHSARMFLLTAASLLFYSAWRWPFTSLLLLTTFLNHITAQAIHRTDHPRQRKAYLVFGIGGSLGLLCFFKYTNFILSSLEYFLGIFGPSIHAGPLPIILPLGISFYTFQAMSYTIDVYRGQVIPKSSFWDVVLFISFFPQLVAGPILRASVFMPQLDELKTYDPTRVKSGLLLMIWGICKKLLVADALAPIVEQAYAQPEQYSGMALVLATYCFAFQIYCDFSGYSDVAIGAAKVLGFEIPLNFNRPYFATNIRDFWRRWHISLSTWLRDYLYIPLGGSRCGRPRIIFNLMVTMLLGGLWHGASWNFVLWGFIHGFMLSLVVMWSWLGQSSPMAGQQNQKPPPRRWSHLYTWPLLAFLNFQVVCLAWVFFRAETFQQAIGVLWRIFEWGEGLMIPWWYPTVVIPLLIVIQGIQTKVRITDFLIQSPRCSRLIIYGGIGLILALVSSRVPVDFIYFVF